MKQRILFGLVIAAILVLPGFWLSGWNFDSRGGQAAACYGLFLFVWLMAATCPFLPWHD